MSAVALPGSRPLGRAMIIGTAACRSQPLRLMQGLGYQCAEVEDVYAAMAELCRRPLVYRLLILSLGSAFREELGLIAAVKQRFTHLDVYVSGIEGRQGTLAEAMRLGADGLVGDDGLHRNAAGEAAAAGTASGAVEPAVTIESAGQSDESPDAPPVPQERPREAVPRPRAAAEEEDSAEPVLTAEELHALLEDHEPSARGSDR